MTGSGRREATSWTKAARRSGGIAARVGAKHDGREERLERRAGLEPRGLVVQPHVEVVEARRLQPPRRVVDPGEGHRLAPVLAGVLARRATMLAMFPAPPHWATSRAPGRMTAARLANRASWSVIQWNAAFEKTASTVPSTGSGAAREVGADELDARIVAQVRARLLDHLLGHVQRDDRSARDAVEDQRGDAPRAAARVEDALVAHQGKPIQHRGAPAHLRDRRSGRTLRRPTRWSRRPILEGAPGRYGMLVDAMTPDNDEYLAANRALWDEWTGIHETSVFYDLDGFRQGGVRLRDFEIEDVGPVEGKTLLHLQCHFGIDSLSWARLGARVTGRRLLAEGGRAGDAPRRRAAPGCAVRPCSNVYDLPETLEGEFDVVYTSRGVLGWLPDVGGVGEGRRALRQARRRLLHPRGAPGGAGVAGRERAPGELRLHYPYFTNAEPFEFDTQGSYADPRPR